MKMFKMTAGGGQALLSSKQSAWKKALLYILMPVFCVALCAGAVFLCQNNSKKISAEAATTTVSSQIKPALSFGAVKYAQTTTNTAWGGTTAAATAFTYSSSMSAANPDSANISCTATVNGDGASGTISTAFNMNSYKSKIIAVPIYLTFDLPANTIYYIKWNWSFSNVVASQEHAMHQVQDSFTQLDHFLVGDYHGKWSSNPNGPAANSDIVVYNDTNTDKTGYTLYSVYYAYVSNTSSGTRSFSFNLSVDFLEGPQIEAPSTTGSTSDDYTGSPLSFGFKYAGTPSVAQVYYEGSKQTITYDKAYECVEVASIVGTYPNGNSIAVSDSTVELNGTTNGEGVFKPTEAGTYTLKLKIKDSFKTSGVLFDDGSTEKSLTFTVKPKKIVAPTVLNATQTYKADEYEFGLSGYDSTLMSVPANGYTSNNGSTITWDGTAEKFKATDAAEYTVKFHLDSPNYVWDVDGGETTNDQAKKITINKKEITINTTPAAASSPSWNFGDTGSIAVNASATGITSPDFVLNIYYVKDGAPTSPITAGVDTATNTLDVSQIANSGKYTLCIELTSAGANKNYSIANNKFEMPFEIKSGGIDFSVIEWQYKEGDGNFTSLFNGGVQEEIRYKLDGDGNKVAYYVSAIIPSGGYLSVDTGYNSDGYTNGFYTVNDSNATVNYGDSVGKYKTRVALKSDADHLFKSESNAGSFGGDNTKGWYEIEWEIKKGKVDDTFLNNIQDYIQYKTAGGSWQTYDPSNPPQYGSGAIEIRVNPNKYPAGITNAEITVNDKNTAIGNYTSQVKFTYDPNFESEGNKSFTWSIGAQEIEVDWTADFWKDSSGNNVVDANNVPYQIRVLNIKDDLKQYVEYRYYIADPTDPSQRGAFIGTGDTALNDLINPPYNASSTNAVYVYVEAALKSGVTQYKLKDNSGGAYDCCTLYRLGSTNTLVKITQSVSEMEYGEDKLKPDIFSLLDTGVNGELDQSTYLEGIYIYDSANTNLGLLSDFDGSTANVGTYTIVIKLNAAGEGTYTLTPGSNYTFTIKPKEVAAPSLKEGVTFTYNGELQSIVDNLENFNGDFMEFAVAAWYDGITDAGTYNIVIKVKEEYKGNYVFVVPENSSNVTEETTVINFTVEKKEIALPTVGEIVFSGNYINLTDYLGGSYEEYKDIISISGDYFDIRNVSQSGYKAKLTLNNPNYKWATPSTAETASLKLFAAKLFDNELAILDDSTVELSWNIAPLLVDASEMWNKGKEGATLNFPENINALITGETLTIGYRYYDDAGQYIESPELAGGKSFRVEAIFGGIDADSGNVLFKTADGNLNAVSDKISYTVPQSGVAAFFGSTLNFLKANWLWFVIGAAVLLFLIILICIIAAAKKKKRKREELEEQRRLEKEEREREERRLEREERMARMNQQQAMPQPQYIPQPMPQMQPQYMPQQVQPMTMPVGGGNGGSNSNEIAELKAEISALKAAQESVKEMAEIKAEQAAMRAEATLRAEAALRAEQGAMHSDYMYDRFGGNSRNSTGMNVDAMTEIMTMALKNVLASATQQVVASQPAQLAQPPAQLTDGTTATATANAVYPPDAVMTTVTTTKIDTTKKPVQGSTQSKRPVARNYVAPMPVDDGRVFDVGGFYTPADPVTDFNFDDEEDKK